LAREEVDDDARQKQQVSAKILDFDWILIPGNAEYLVKTLAETENEAIFNKAQIRVFVQFMWSIYSKEL
jgi:hypothetical protein